MSDGTEQNQTMTVDVVAGGQALGLSGFFIPPNSEVGDRIYMSEYAKAAIADETTRAYAGANRTFVYTGFSQYEIRLAYYWDKHTGVIVESIDRKLYLAVELLRFGERSMLSPTVSVVVLSLLLVELFSVSIFWQGDRDI